MCLCFLVLQQLMLHSSSNIVTSKQEAEKRLDYSATIKYLSRSVALFAFILCAPIWTYIFFPCFFFRPPREDCLSFLQGSVWFPISVTVFLLAFLCVCDKMGAETETKLLILEEYSLCACLMKFHMHRGAQFLPAAVHTSSTCPCTCFCGRKAQIVFLDYFHGTDWEQHLLQLIGFY